MLLIEDVSCIVSSTLTERAPDPQLRVLAWEIKSYKSYKYSEKR